MIERALEYARYGWSIFPCHSLRNGECSCGKVACKNQGKHPRTISGVKDATTDIESIMRWWTQWPDANIAMATGKINNIFVVDIDPRYNGYESIETYEVDRGDPLPKTLAARTGSGGRHLFYRYPDISLAGRNPWLTGVDIKSDGGYVIIAPSNHLSGNIYVWENLGKVDPVEAPGDLVFEISNGNAAAAGKESVSDTASILSGIPEGQRDDKLFRWACRLRRQHSGDDDGGRAAVTALVLDAARRCTPPFPDDDALAKVDQAFKQNHADNTWDWDFVTEAGDPIFRLTDLGNSVRFAHHFTADLRYVPGWGWVHWTETGWARGDDGQLQAERFATQVPEIIRTEASRFDGDPDRKNQIMKWSVLSEAAGRIAAVEKLARSNERLAAHVEQFDADPMQLACSNGVVDLRTGELRPFDREDYMTMNTGTAYNANARDARWEAFIDSCTNGDKELAKYLQLASGYTLTGSNALECFFIVSGLPQSGKSTFIDAIQTVMGLYSLSTQSDTFMYRRNQPPPKDELARFVGKRMISVSEIKQGDSFNESLIKQFTGNDLITARELYKTGFSFRPQMKLWIATNYDPDTKDGAMWRRLKKIAFNHQIPAGRQDTTLKDHLHSRQGSMAVLAWMVAGATEWWQTKRLNEPEAVIQATADYHEEQDRFAHFLRDSIEPSDDDDGIDVRDLYSSYRLWCMASNEFPMKITSFTPELRTRGFTIQRAPSGERFVIGVRTKQVSFANAAAMQWG